MTTRPYLALYKGEGYREKGRLNTEVRKETRKKIEKERIDVQVAKRKQISRCERGGRPNEIAAKYNFCWWERREGH